jgi:hypothetical protein
MNRINVFRDMIYLDSPPPSRAAANGESVSTPSSTDSPNETAERNYDAFLKRIGKAVAWDTESTEGRYGQ